MGIADIDRQPEIRVKRGQATSLPTCFSLQLCSKSRTTSNIVLHFSLRYNSASPCHRTFIRCKLGFSNRFGWAKASNAHSSGRMKWFWGGVHTSARHNECAQNDDPQGRLSHHRARILIRRGRRRIESLLSRVPHTSGNGGTNRERRETLPGAWKTTSRRVQAVARQLTS